MLSGFAEQAIFNVCIVLYVGISYFFVGCCFGEVYLAIGTIADLTNLRVCIFCLQNQPFDLAVEVEGVAHQISM